MVKLDLEKAEEPEMKLPTSAGSLKKARVPEKHVLLINWLCQSLCVDHNKLWKILERWEYQTSWPASWEIRMYVKTQQLEPDMEQQTGSKLGKEYIKAVYCHPAYLTYMQSQFSSVAQSCPTLCDPMDCNLPSSSVRGIF